MIDIEFYKIRKYEKVREAWRSYLSVRTNSSTETDADEVRFYKKCDATLTDLLVQIGQVLGYYFSPMHVKQSIYRSQGHATQADYQMFMRCKLSELFSGKFSLPAEIKFLKDKIWEKL